MNNKTIITFTVLAIIITEVPFIVSAQTATKINARILPTIWYSSLLVNDGDSIEIYAAIQNNSGIDFSGTAEFIVDGQNISQSNFSSTDGILKDLFTKWVAIPGTHTVEVDISANLPPGKELVSYASDKSSISIIRSVSAAAVQQTVVNAATTVINNTDVAANNLADKVESMKIEPASTTDAVQSQNIFAQQKTSVIKDVAKANAGVVSKSGIGQGPNSEPSSSPDLTASLGNLGDQAYNAVLDLLAFLLRHWIWTISGLVVIGVILRFL